MKKQQKNILLILLFSGFSMVSSATLAMCRMSDIGAGQIRLQPVSGSTSTTGVSVECDRMFTIKFDSQNMLNMNGESMLKGQHLSYAGKNNHIRVKYSLHGDAGMLWQKNVLQHKKSKHHYIIKAELQNFNAARVRAGDYSDSIMITVDY